MSWSKRLKQPKNLARKAGQVFIFLLRHCPAVIRRIHRNHPRHAGRVTIQGKGRLLSQKLEKEDFCLKQSQAKEVMYIRLLGT